MSIFALCSSSLMAASSGLFRSNIEAPLWSFRSQIKDWWGYTIGMSNPLGNVDIRSLFVQPYGSQLWTIPVEYRGSFVVFPISNKGLVGIYNRNVKPVWKCRYSLSVRPALWQPALDYSGRISRLLCGLSDLK